MPRKSLNCLKVTFKLNTFFTQYYTTKDSLVDMPSVDLQVIQQNMYFYSDFRE